MVSELLRRGRERGIIQYEGEAEAKESKPGKKKPSDDDADATANRPKPGELRKELDLALLSADMKYRVRRPNCTRDDIEKALRDVEILFYKERGDSLRATFFTSERAKIDA